MRRPADVVELMTARMLLPLGLAFLLAVPVLAELPSVEVDKIRDDSAGGSFTLAQVVVVDGKKTFLKSNRGSMRGTRYSNFESDILAKGIFDLLGMRCPGATVVRVVGGKTSRWMGSVALAMEFVDTRFARGTVFNGGWPGDDLAHVEEFIRMLLVDIVIGNADRREANFFVTVPYPAVKKGKEKPGSYRPVPIDNNCGFASMVVWRFPTSQTNFLPTYEGLGKSEVLCDLGTIRNIALDSPLHRMLLSRADYRPRIVEAARELQGKLTDRTIGEMVEKLPSEIIPRGVSVDPTPVTTRLPADVDRDLLFGGIREPISGKKLFEHRKSELRRVLAWRRDHLVEALEKYFQETPPEAAE